jgi:hypothetical protein
MTTSPKTDIILNELVNNALDASYTRQAGPILKQIMQISRSRNSPIQQALKELDDEAERLEAEGKPMKIDNAVLMKVMKILHDVFNSSAMLIQSGAGSIQNEAMEIAPAAITAQVFPQLSGQLIALNQNPILPSALPFYQKILRERGIKWRTGQ